MDSGPANNIRRTAPEGNRQPGFHRSKLPARTERASFVTAENAKAQTVLFLIRYLRPGISIIGSGPTDNLPPDRPECNWRPGVAPIEGQENK